MRALAVALLVMVALSNIGEAQGTGALRDEPLPVRVAVEMSLLETVFPPVVSPDGHRLAYVVRQAAPDTGAAAVAKTATWTGSTKGLFANLTIYVVDVAGTSPPRVISGGAGASWAPQWSPDGASLAFYSTRDGLPHLWLWRRTDGALKRVSPAVVWSWGASHPDWMPDGRALVATFLPEQTDVADALQLPWDQAAAHRSVAVYRAHLPGADSLVPDYILRPTDLAVVDVATGVVRRIVRRTTIGQYALAPDGRTLAYVEMHGNLPSTFFGVGSLVIIPVAGGPALVHRTLTTPGWGSRLAWSPSSRYLLTREAEGDRLQSSTEPSPRAVEPAPGQATCHDSPGGRVRVSESICRFGRGDCLGWTTPGDTLLCQTTDSLFVWPADGGHPGRAVAPRPPAQAEIVAASSGPFWYQHTLLFLTPETPGRPATLDLVDLAAGAQRRVYDFPVRTVIGAMAAIASARPGAGADDRFVYVRQTAVEPPDLWALPLGREVGRVSERRLTRLNPTLMQYAMGQSRVVSWHTLYGDSLQGSLLVPPARFKPPYPLVVWVYPQFGFADDADYFGASHGIYDQMQVLATRGYAVLQPDMAYPLGANSHDQTDMFVPGILKLADERLIDLTRVGVTGMSNGGHEVISVITHTSLFKAAVTESGYASEVAQGGVMETPTIPYAPGALGWARKLYTNPAAVIEQSPLFLLDRVRTPLLIVSGTRDDAVPLEQQQELFVRLRQLGKPVEFLTYEGEDHEYDWWHYRNRVDRWDRVIAWFDHWLTAAPTAAGPGVRATGQPQ